MGKITMGGKDISKPFTLTNGKKVVSITLGGKTLTLQPPVITKTKDMKIQGHGGTYGGAMIPYADHKAQEDLAKANIGSGTYVSHTLSALSSWKQVRGATWADGYNDGTRNNDIYKFIRVYDVQHSKHTSGKIDFDYKEYTMTITYTEPAPHP